MRKLVVLLTVILLVVNLVLDITLSAYQTTNMILNSVVILLTGTTLWILSTVRLKDAFKYSLSILFGIIGFVEYILGFFAPHKWDNNWFAIMILSVLTIETITVLLTNYISNKNN